jgi:hypothetical protein
MRSYPARFRFGQNASLPLVLEPEAVGIDADDDRVVEDAIEHRYGEHTVTGEGGIPTTEGEIIAGSVSRPARTSAGGGMI